MKNYILFIAFLICNNMFSQTNEQKQRILANSNLSALQDLSVIDLEKDKIIESKIEAFLNDNPSAKKRFYSDNVLYEIKDIIDGKPIYLSNQNQKAAQATRTSRLHTGGSLGLNLDGTNMLIGIWDGGKVLTSHVEFMDDQAPVVTRVQSPDAPLPSAPTDDHGTHVAGTMVAKGVNPLAKGMAPKANLVSYNWTNDMSEVVTQITNNGLLLSNHSYGIPVLNDEGQLNVPAWRMGAYDTEARDWDQVAFNAPYYLMVASAGNSGTDVYTGGIMAGFDKLTGEKNSKNNLVVANADPFVIPATGALISYPINSSSSQGPSDDGRIKPDIAADGTSLFSTYNTNNSSYATLSGTSMASPNTSGTLLLLQEYYSRLSSGNFMRSSSLKGLVCHTAVDGGVVGPDAKFGWGLLDAEKSANLIRNSFDSAPKAILLEEELSQGETFTFDVSVNASQKLEATICWIDPAGSPNENQLNSSTPALVNDLDLRIIKGSEINLPWKLQLSNVSSPAIKADNVVDNIEKVEVNNAIGTYTVRITHKGNLSNSLQKFSLIISGFDQSLGNEDYNKLNKISLYPNPVNDLLSIAGAETIIKGYNIFDIQGRLIKQFTSSNSINQIDVSSLDSGVYLLKLKSELGEVVKRFIKK